MISSDRICKSVDIYLMASRKVAMISFRGILSSKQIDVNIPLSLLASFDRVRVFVYGVD